MSENTFGFVKVYEDFDYIGQIPWEPGLDVEEAVRVHFRDRLFRKMTAKYHYTIILTTIKDLNFLTYPCNEQKLQ